MSDIYLRDEKYNPLYEYKKAENLSWEKFARKLDVSMKHLMDLAGWKYGDIMLSTAKKIKKVTGLTPDQYLNTELTSNL